MFLIWDLRFLSLSWNSLFQALQMSLHCSGIPISPIRPRVCRHLRVSQAQIPQRPRRDTQKQTGLFIAEGTITSIAWHIYFILLITLCIR